MRHRPSEPLVNLWRRLPRAVAGRVTVLSELNAVRAMTVLAITLGFGTSALVAVASVSRPSNEAAGPTAVGPRPVPTASRDGRRPDGTGSPGRPGRSTPGAPVTSRSPSSSPPTRPAERTSRTAAPGQSRRRGSQVPPDSGSSISAGSSPSGGEAQPAPEDRTPPDTSVTTRFPDGDAAVFSFDANEHASYACSLDLAPYTACDSPADFSGLHPGWHTFAVRATDAAGNVDPSPAEVRWHANAGSSTDPGSRRP